MPLSISSYLPTTSELEHNISVSLTAGLFSKDNSVDIMKMSKSSMYLLMFDEIKIEEIPHYSATGNSIVGVCQEHSAQYAVEYASEHEAYWLFEGVKDGDIHIVTEMSAYLIHSICFSDWLS